MPAIWPQSPQPAAAHRGIATRLGVRPRTVAHSINVLYRLLRLAGDPQYHPRVRAAYLWLTTPPPAGGAAPEILVEALATAYPEPAALLRASAEQYRREQAPPPC